MSKTNCVNCGASKEVSDLQCPFCGTKYADFTTFDFFNDEPFFIQLRNKDGKVITAKAYTTRRELTIKPIEYEMRAPNGELRRFFSQKMASGSIDFSLYESL